MTGVQTCASDLTLLPGGSYCHHADSFAMIRGGHLDLCVLGAFQVAENGDLANWSRSATHMPQIGGAMDLVAGTRRVWITMEHTTADGRPKLLRRCTYPLTGAGVVQRVYTELAVLDVTPEGFRVLRLAPGVDLAMVQSRTEAPLLAPA